MVGCYLVCSTEAHRYILNFRMSVCVCRAYAWQMKQINAKQQQIHSKINGVCANAHSAEIEFQRKQICQINGTNGFTFGKMQTTENARPPLVTQHQF